MPNLPSTGPKPDKLPLTKMPLDTLRAVLPSNSPLFQAVEPLAPPPQPPSLPIDVDGPAGASVPENLALYSPVGITVQAVDPEGAALRYSFDADSTITTTGPFSIDPVSGVISLTSSLNFETQDSYLLQVFAHDGNLSSSATFEILVEDVDEGHPPTDWPTSGTLTLAEYEAVDFTSGAILTYQSYEELSGHQASFDVGIARVSSPTDPDGFYDNGVALLDDGPGGSILFSLGNGLDFSDVTQSMLDDAFKLDGASVSTFESFQSMFAIQLPDDGGYYLIDNLVLDPANNTVTFDYMLFGG